MFPKIACRHETCTSVEHNMGTEYYTDEGNLESRFPPKPLYAAREPSPTNIEGKYMCDNCRAVRLPIQYTCSDISSGAGGNVPAWKHVAEMRYMLVQSITSVGYPPLTYTW